MILMSQTDWHRFDSVALSGVECGIPSPTRARFNRRKTPLFPEKSAKFGRIFEKSRQNSDRE
jgi:hypothetical protein